MTLTDDLTQFLRQRTGEDREATQKVLNEATDVRLKLQGPEFLGRVMPGWWLWPDVIRTARGRLAEVDAKRQRLALLDEALTVDPNDALAHRLLRMEALPYAGCDGYRREWAPQFVPTNESIDCADT